MYEEQSLQAVKEISEQYIESQKAIINSIQSAWKPYSEKDTMEWLLAFYLQIL